MIVVEQSAEISHVAGTPALRDRLERVVALQSRAAATFRANRMHSEAARAQRFAARARLLLDEPEATRRMHALTRELYESPNGGSLLERALEGAMSLIGGDFGNAQLNDPTKGGLRIAAQCGFGSEFLEYFAIVDDDTSACGRAASQRFQTVIVDVNQDPTFASHREIAATTGFRAVQSTPLVDPAGRLRGVISTHFQRPHRPSSRDLQLIEWYAEHVAAALGQRQNHPTTLYDATAALHARTVDPHDTAVARINNGAQALLTTNGNDAIALALRESAHRARERARQECGRAQDLRERVRNQNERLPSPS